MKINLTPKRFEGFPCGRCENRIRYKSNGNCVQCAKANKKSWQASEKSKTYQRNHKLKLRYGITSEQADRMFEEQGNVCIICQKAEMVMCVDHDHKTKEVRGILCSSCNRALGFLRENTETMRRMVAYIERM